MEGSVSMSTKKVLNIVLVVLTALLSVTRAIGDMDVPTECDGSDK